MNGMQDMEKNITSNIRTLVDELRAVLMEEKWKGQHLEQRVVQLKEPSTNEDLEKQISELESRLRTLADGRGETADVDKSVVAIGSFLEEKAIQEVEPMIKELVIAVNE